MNWENFNAGAPPVREARIEEFRRPDPPPDPEDEARAAAEAARRAEEEALAEMLARARGEGRAEGFEQGAAQAESAFIAERRLILSEIRERLSDAELAETRREAETLAALRALAEALAGALAPALARRGLAAEIAAAVEAAQTHAPPGAPRVEIRARAERLPAIRAALEEAGLDAELVADDRLDALEARAVWGDGVDSIYLNRCAEAALAAVAAHFQDEEERMAHG